MIASFFDGRVRIRREELREPATMDLVMAFIRSRDGILDLAPNLRTGSLVITYDPEKIPRQTLLEAAEALEKQFGPVKKAKPEPKSGRKKGRGMRIFSPLEETGMLGVLYGVTLLSGFVSRRAHIVGAVLLTGLTAAHVYTRRKYL